MNLLKLNRLRVFAVFTVGLLGCLHLKAQTPDYPSNLDIAIRLDSNITQAVKINGVFGVSAQVYLEANSSTIPERGMGGGKN